MAGDAGATTGGAPGGVQGNPEPLEISNAPFVEVTAPRKIRSVRFSLMSPQEIGKCGVFHVFERNLYQMPQRVPLPNGILDTRMGTTDKKGAECATCKGKLIDCAGHFGYIKLEMPVFHIGYFKNIIAILQQVCKTCSRVMLSPEEKTQYLKRFRNPRLEIVPRRALSKKLSEKCKRCRTCYYCGAANGVVKRAGASLKIVHEKYSKNPDLMEQYMGEFEEAVKHNEQLRANLGRVQDDLSPIRVLGILKKISPTDCELLDVADRPEHLILTHLPVPPVCIRPSVEMDGVAGSNEDDVTMKLIQIIEVNNVLRQGLDKGLDVDYIRERLMPMLHSNSNQYQKQLLATQGSSAANQMQYGLQGSKNIIVFPFSLNPEGSNPSGAVNFSKVSHATLKLHMEDAKSAGPLAPTARDAVALTTTATTLTRTTLSVTTTTATATTASYNYYMYSF
mgnify:CR=1 FL=1